MRYERSLAIADRLETLVGLIRTGAYSTPALAQKLSVSEQTVYRDVLFLKQHGYAIRSAKRSSGWAYQLEAEPSNAVHAKGSPGT